VARVLSLLSIVVVPCIVALLLTALLQPLTARLRRAYHAGRLRRGRPPVCADA
jgi:predicted PurR-regulated permease PerM